MLRDLPGSDRPDHLLPDRLSVCGRRGFDIAEHLRSEEHRRSHRRPTDVVARAFTLLQALVGGLIECVSLSPIYDLWVNEEGLLLGLARNRGHLCGPIVVTRTNDAGETVDLDDLDIHRLKELLAGA